MTPKHLSADYLSLDQGIFDGRDRQRPLGDDVLRRTFATPDLRLPSVPVLGVEEFGIAPRGCTITGSARRRAAARHPPATT